ncbi:MAG: hypothetical protein ACRDTH_01880 [Pseudonocardiaceae bacterium]
MAPTWLSGVKAVAQLVAGALPALMLVIFAGVLSLLGLACDQGRRDYALAYADRFIDLAAVLVGRPRKASTPNPQGQVAGRSRTSSPSGNRA